VDVDLTMTGVAYFSALSGPGSKAACRATALKMIVNPGPQRPLNPLKRLTAGGWTP